MVTHVFNCNTWEAKAGESSWWLPRAFTPDGLVSLGLEGTLHAIKGEHELSHKHFDLQWCPACRIH